MIFEDDDYLGDARTYVTELAYGAGGTCPCCEQHVKVYKRTINWAMARSIAIMWREARLEWINVPEVVGARSREEGKLAYWGLVQESSLKRDDGGRRGWWRVTHRGEWFVKGILKVPKYALIYNGQCLGLDGPEVSINDCVRERFNLAELLARRAS